jgi:hypothetical protein
VNRRNEKWCHTMALHEDRRTCSLASKTCGSNNDANVVTISDDSFISGRNSLSFDDAIETFVGPGV